MNLSDEIRKQIEKNKGLKLAVGEINNHLSTLEGLVRNDIEGRKNEAYQKGFEDGKAVNDKGCEGCLYNDGTKEHSPCDICCNAYLNRWTAKPQEDDDIKVGDEVIYIEHKFIVFATETEEHYASLFDVNGRHASASQSKCKKTGRHFDVPKILEEMRT